MDFLSLGDLLFSAGGFGIGVAIIYRLGSLATAVKDIEDRLENLEQWRNEVVRKFFLGGA